MTTLTPTEKTLTYNTNDVDNVHELVKEALRDSSFKSCNIFKRSVFDGVEDETSFEVNTRFVLCKT